MISPTSLLRIVHLVGLCLAVGAASAKLVMLIRFRNETLFQPSLTHATETLTRMIAAGMLLLVLSGIGWLLLGYPFSARLVIKLVLVALMPVTGALINRMEHRLMQLRPADGAANSPALLLASKRYFALEASATGLFYLIIAVWVLR